ncbi:MAG: Re/Si-specific NAD(P)(+) transhydrogenase subunit alpha [Bacteroidia bacterium]|nr:Re/Si-specific NAD(P)(+) transhydrogenase subunit alpha [Bacteroidia bacterium]
MIIGILKEKNDARVSLTPDTVSKLTGSGHEVKLEDMAGVAASYINSAYTNAGASIVSRESILSQSDLITTISPPEESEIAMMKAGSVLISLFNPLVEKEKAEKLRQTNILPFSLDRIPRTTIAQSMDVLSSMASLAGYKAVVMAANLLPGYFPMMMTAAGTIPPARVLILGAGVAGLQAIATAKRLGATVEAFDVRSAAREEVESLGAKFVEVEGAREDKAAGGYAVEQSEEYLRKQKELIHERAARSHVVITTANIPGRKAPLLIEQRTVEAMLPGSVIIDLAAASGGNCAVTQNGEIINFKGITVVGKSDLPSSMPRDASKLYSNNLFNFFKYVFKNGIEGLDFSNEIVAATYLGSPKETAKA